jgi:hypothetical protein
MTMKHLRALACCLMLGAAGHVSAENYQVGQIWSYKTRPQEPDSTLMILRIDNTSKLGPVVFIGLQNVRIRQSNGRVVATMSPIPITKDALDQSVLKVVGKTDKVMPSDKGYANWKATLLSGKNPPTHVKPVAATINDIENGSWMMQKGPDTSSAQ